MVFGLSRFALNEAAPAAGTPPVSTPAAGGVTPPPSTLATVDDFFDAAINEITNEWSDPSDRQIDDGINPDDDFFGDEDDSAKEEKSKPEGDGVDSNKGAAAKGEDGEFKPYTFKATVDGKEVERTFKSKDDLDKHLARAEVAPRLYSRVQKLDKQIQELQPDAEFARDMIGMAKEDPKEFLKILESELIDFNSLSAWVYDKYHEFSKLGNMTPEQQEQYLMQQEARRIIEESRYQRQLDESRRQTETAQREAQERKEFNTWKNREVDRWTQAVPSEYRDNVLTAVKSVVAYSRRQIDNGHEVTYRQMSGMINKMLEPYKRSMSPDQRAREVAKAVEEKKDQATSAVRQAARTSSATRPEEAKGKKAFTVDDIFDGAIAGIKTGRNHWVHK